MHADVKYCCMEYSTYKLLSVCPTLATQKERKERERARERERERKKKKTKTKTKKVVKFGNYKGKMLTLPFIDGKLLPSVLWVSGDPLHYMNDQTMAHSVMCMNKPLP